MEQYRLIQDGITVASAEGPSALREIKHYAAVYRYDGPVMIEQRVGKRWKPMTELMVELEPALLIVAQDAEDRP